MAEDWELKSLERRVEALEKKNERRARLLGEWLLEVIQIGCLVAAVAYILWG